jgi:Zn-dependent membrane protease YugP
MNIWLILIAVMVASAFIQQTLQRKFRKYSEVGIPLSGAEVASRMLRENGIMDVKVMSISGELTDHYDPTNKTLNLSESVYNQRNIAAAAVAAHECGHAIQHATGYAPLQLRSSLVKVVSFSNKYVSWVLLLGVLMINVTSSFLWLGIALFAASTLFSLVTLPVEINASSRAVQWLDSTGIATYETKPMAEDALKWAAYTYVIAAVGSIATLLYYIGIARNR